MLRIGCGRKETRFVNPGRLICFFNAEDAEGAEVLIVGNKRISSLYDMIKKNF